MVYDFGPINKVMVTLSGEAEEHYNQYDLLPDNVQEALQLICHGVCQISGVLAQAEFKPYYIGDISVIKIENKYLFSDSELMTIVNVERIGVNYDIEFFSVNRLVKIQPLIDLAYKHFEKYGRVLN